MHWKKMKEMKEMKEAQKAPECILMQINLLKYLDPSVQTLNLPNTGHWLRANKKQFKGRIISQSRTKNGCEMKREHG